MGEQDWYFLYTHAQLTKKNIGREKMIIVRKQTKKKLGPRGILMIDTCLVVIIIIIFWFSKSIFFFNIIRKERKERKRSNCFFVFVDYKEVWVMTKGQGGTDVRLAIRFRSPFGTSRVLLRDKFVCSSSVVGDRVSKILSLSSVWRRGRRGVPPESRCSLPTRRSSGQRGSSWQQTFPFFWKNKLLPLI